MGLPAACLNDGRTTVPTSTALHTATALDRRCAVTARVEVNKGTGSPHHFSGFLFDSIPRVFPDAILVNHDADPARRSLLPRGGSPSPSADTPA